MDKKASNSKDIEIPKYIAVIFLVLVTMFCLPIAIMSYSPEDGYKKSVALFMGIMGVWLSFIGNALTMDTIGRLDAEGLPTWRWGNRMQNIGFSLTFIGLILASN